MKKAILSLAAIMLLASCASLKFEGLRPVLGDDLGASGETLGRAAYIAYLCIKDDPNHADEVAEVEKVWAAIEQGSLSASGAGAVNQAALDACQTMLLAKYSQAEALLMVEAIRIGGGIGDRLVESRVDMEQANAFVDGFIRGVKKSQEASK